MCAKYPFMDFRPLNSLLESIRDDLEVGHIFEAVSRLTEAVRIDPDNFYGNGPIKDNTRKGAAKMARDVRKKAASEPGWWHQAQKYSMYRQAGAKKRADAAGQKMHDRLSKSEGWMDYDENQLPRRRRAANKSEMKLGVAGRMDGFPVKDDEKDPSPKSTKLRVAIKQKQKEKQEAAGELASPSAARTYAAQRAAQAKPKKKLIGMPMSQPTLKVAATA